MFLKSTTNNHATTTTTLPPIGKLWRTFSRFGLLTSLHGTKLRNQFTEPVSQMQRWLDPRSPPQVLRNKQCTSWTVPKMAKDWSTSRGCNSIWTWHYQPRFGVTITSQCNVTKQKARCGVHTRSISLHRSAFVDATYFLRYGARDWRRGQPSRDARNVIKDSGFRIRSGCLQNRI